MPHQNPSVLFQNRFRHASSFFHRSFLVSLYVFRPVRASCFLLLWIRNSPSVSACCASADGKKPGKINMQGLISRGEKARPFSGAFSGITPDSVTLPRRHRVGLFPCPMENINSCLHAESVHHSAVGFPDFFLYNESTQKKTPAWPI